MESIIEKTKEVEKYMRLIDDNNYNLFTYDNIVRTDDPKFALELFESEGVYAISVGEQWSINSQSHEILLGYKDTDFAVDIYHLHNTNKRLHVHENLTEKIYSDNSTFSIFNNLTSEGTGHFESYYAFCPELIEPDGFRVEIVRFLAELSILKLQFKFDEYSFRCAEFRESIEFVIKGYVNQYLGTEQRYLNLMAYNPNPAFRRY